MPGFGRETSQGHSWSPASDSLFQVLHSRACLAKFEVHKMPLARGSGSHAIARPKLRSFRNGYGGPKLAQNPFTMPMQLAYRPALHARQGRAVLGWKSRSHLASHPEIASEVRGKRVMTGWVSGVQYAFMMLYSYDTAHKSQWWVSTA